MAFPAIQGTPAETSFTAVGTSFAVGLPAGIQAGETLVVLLAGGGTNALQFNTLAGWTELVDENVAFGLHVWYRIADGSEGATVTFTSTGSGSRGAAIAYRISDGHPTQAPQISAVATGSGTAPDPAALSPTGGAKDYLWITFFAQGSTEEANDDTWLNNAATNYSNPLQVTSGTGGVNVGAILGASSRTANAATEDASWPSGSVDTSAAWRAFTLAVHPTPPPTATGTARISLASASTPPQQIAHSLHIRGRVTSGTGKFRMQLWEGATQRCPPSGYLESAALTTSLADYKLPIADTDADAITDYSDLEVRFWGYSQNGGSIVYEVDQVWFELPAAGAGGETPPPGGAVAGGLAPGVQAPGTQGGASANGTVSVGRVAVPQGGGAVAGLGPTTRASLTIGGAVAGGRAPSEPGGTSETPVPGGAVAGGRAPGISTGLMSGGGTALGSDPVVRTAVTIGGAGVATAAQIGLIYAWSAGVPSASIVVTTTPGGATAGGFAPASGGMSQSPTPGGATAGGLSSGATVVTPVGGAPAAGSTSTGVQVSTSVGGAPANGRTLAPSASVLSGGAVAGGRAPSESTSSGDFVLPGGGIAGGFAPGVRVTTPQGGVSSGGFAPVALYFQMPLPGGATAGGLSPAIKTSTAIGSLAAAGRAPAPGVTPVLGGGLAAGRTATVAVYLGPGGAIGSGKIADPLQVFIVDFYDQPHPRSGHLGHRGPSTTGAYDEPDPMKAKP